MQVWGSISANKVGDLVRINGLHFCTVLYEVKWLFVIHSVKFLKFEHKSFYFLFVFERKRWREAERRVCSLYIRQVSVLKEA